MTFQDGSAALQCACGSSVAQGHVLNGTSEPLHELFHERPFVMYSRRPLCISRTFENREMLYFHVSRFTRCSIITIHETLYTHDLRFT